jgi:hypothetical protein
MLPSTASGVGLDRALMSAIWGLSPLPTNPLGAPEWIESRRAR